MSDTFSGTNTASITKVDVRAKNMDGSNATDWDAWKIWMSGQYPGTGSDTVTPPISVNPWNYISYTSGKTSGYMTGVPNKKPPPISNTNGGITNYGSNTALVSSRRKKQRSSYI